MSFPNSYVKILFPHVMILRCGAFGWKLSHEGGGLMNGIRDLMRRETRKIISSPCEDTGRRLPSANQE